LGPYPTQRGDSHKNAKIGWGHLNIFLPRATGPISTKLDINHPWGKGIPFYTNEGPHSSQRGDNVEIAKIH
jgi:hypothetical protein